jgi:hypothetical protein
MEEVMMVGYGVDTLILNVHYTTDGKPVKRELEKTLHAQLDLWKKSAQGVHEEYPTPLTFNGAVLHMQPNGAGKGQWPWMLKSRDITLSVSGGQWNGIASVRLSSEYLWSCRGLLDALRAVQRLVNGLFEGVMYLQVSSVDLCVDVAGWQDIEWLDTFEHFITRSRKRAVYAVPEWGYAQDVREYAYGKQTTGFTFGKDGKGRSPLSCRIYDKTREIEQSGKLWMQDIWQGYGWPGYGRVWRVECSIKREVLHELLQEDTGSWGIEDAYVLPDALPLLWAYAVGQVNGGPDGLPDGWLRCVVSNGEKNRSRWPTHPAWKVVQAAFTQSGEQSPEQFGRIIRKRHQEHSIEKGLEAVMGYLTSLAAWAGDDLAEEGVDLSVVLHWLAKEGGDYLERVERDFSAEVQRKRVKFGLAL